MRIIDSQHDYYDYLSDATDKIVFDRRKSFVLTKEMLAHDLAYTDFRNDSKYRLILMQCGATFWLILSTLVKKSPWGSSEPDEIKLELLTSWKNYSKGRRILAIETIELKEMYKYQCYDYALQDYDYDALIANIEKFKDAIDHNDYKVDRIINHYRKYTSHGWTSEAEVLTIPLLKASGFNSIINPVDLFTAIEEHFSLEKTASERIDPLGITNDDKIVMHGFDTKSSFRHPVKA